MLLQVAETTRTRFSALVGQRAGLTSAFAPFLVAQIRDLPQLNQNTPTYRIRRSKLSNLRRTGVRWQSPFSSVHSSCTLPFDIFTPCATWHRIQRTVSVRSVSNSTENSPHLPDPGRGQPRPVVPPRRRVLSFGPFIIITAVTTAAFFRRYVISVHSIIQKVQPWPLHKPIRAMMEAKQMQFMASHLI